MKVVLAKESLRAILCWTQRVLLAGGVSMLGYSGFVLMDGWMYQTREGHRLDQLLTDLQASRTSPAGSARVFGTAATGGVIGRIVIPRLGLSVMVAEGVDRVTLRRAAGHIPGTALPGQTGNICISGHRDTFFRPLRSIQQNDIITLTTLLGEFRYRVVSVKVTRPYDVAVLESSGNEILTLITCYPFYFVGSAPDRFVVRAERVGNAS